MNITDFLEDFDEFMENDHVAVMHWEERSSIFASYVDLKKETVKADWCRERFEELGPKIAEFAEHGDLPTFIDSLFDLDPADLDEEDAEEFAVRVSSATVESLDDEVDSDDEDWPRTTTEVMGDDDSYDDSVGTPDMIDDTDLQPPPWL